MLRPASPLLLERCIEALDTGGHGNDAAGEEAEVALVIAEQFAGDTNVRDRLVERMQRRHYCASSVLTVALHSPGDEALRILRRERRDRVEFGAWATAAHMTAAFSATDDFVRLVVDLVTRPYRSRFDVQHVANLGIELRLRRDPGAARQLAKLITIEQHPSLLASVPRYLADSGAIGAAERTRILELLTGLAVEQRLPLAGYDAVADRVRGVRLSLFDALHAGAEI